MLKIYCSAAKCYQNHIKLYIISESIACNVMFHGQMQPVMVPSVLEISPHLDLAYLASSLSSSGNIPFTTHCSAFSLRQCSNFLYLLVFVRLFRILSGQAVGGVCSPATCSS